MGGIIDWKKKNNSLLNPYTLTSVFILSVVLLLHFLSCWWGEFIQPPRASLVRDHFLYSCNLNVIQGWYCEKKLAASHSFASKS